MLEPFSTESQIKGAQRQAINGGVAITVDRGSWRDVLLYRLEGNAELEAEGIKSDGDVVLVTFNDKGIVKRNLNASMDQISSTFHGS